MIKPFSVALIASVILLAGCAGGAGLRYPVPTIETKERISISYRSVELREVALPRYAGDEAIFRETEAGALESTGLLWADDPSRAITLELSRHLSRISGATVASEPWPFADRADAIVEVRVEEMLADQTGNFRLMGQYFVAPENGRRGRSSTFRLTAPIEANSGIGGLVQARATVVLELARLIAREGLR